MRFLRLSAAALAGALVVAAGEARAFDCAQAKSKVEKALCADPAAKASDDAMSAAFAALRPQLDPGQAKALLTNQRAWLKTRESRCLGDAEKAPAPCLKSENEARVRALSAKPSAGPGVPGRLVPVFVERPGSKREYQVGLFLYRFAAPATPAETAFNAAIDKMIAQAPTKVDDPAPYATTYSYDRSASLAYGSDRLLSVQVIGYEFSGGAHGMSTNTVLNLDLKGGRLFGAQDLLLPEHRADAAKLCRGQVAGQLKSKMKEGGQDPDKDPDEKKSFEGSVKEMEPAIAEMVNDLGNWRFDADYATVIFGQDAIAAHVYGEFECAVPYATLRGWAKPGFPVP